VAEFPLSLEVIHLIHAPVTLPTLKESPVPVLQEAGWAVYAVI
jgi:hypothetical protein